MQQQQQQQQLPRSSAREKWRQFGVPGSFSSAEYLARSSKGRLSRKKAKKDLAGDPTYEAHRERPKRIARRADVATYFSSRFEADLADVGKAFNEREGDDKIHRYFLLVVDVFSRKMWGRGLPNKTGPVVAAAFVDILDELKSPYEYPKVLSSDGGAEFTGRQMKEACEKRGIRTHVAAGTSKASIAERSIRSAKKVLLTALKSGAIPDGLTWDECVRETLKSLNGRYNRALGCSPDEVPQHWRELMRRQWKRKQLTPYRGLRDYTSAKGFGGKFKIGDLVLIPKARGNFRKETDVYYDLMPKVLLRKFSEQRPTLYVVKDPRSKKVLKQKYYATQLRHVKLPGEIGHVSDIQSARLKDGKVQYELEGGRWI